MDGGAGGGGWGWELGEFDFFTASAATVCLSSSFSLPTSSVGQEVHESTSGELPMVSCICVDDPVVMSRARPNTPKRQSSCASKRPALKFHPTDDSWSWAPDAGLGGRMWSAGQKRSRSDGGLHTERPGNPARSE
ncbi:hypothetical protein EYF80_035821 [Liparis tanakae]|uniref:Uncharacterized protein n=1 Tax=Liparis tanakae TaxID=230148 RepID=A0A4Z2GKF2_9TELE|nr:hypothetical protein EYF80_035821 [Liparis tanakae]